MRIFAFISLLLFPLIVQSALPDEMACLTSLVHYEARGESIKGQQAVVHVVFNRMKAYNLTACQVVRQPGQFSWVKAHKVRLLDQYTPIVESVSGDEDFTDGALYFRHKKSRTTLGKKAKHTVTIGNHTFWRL